MNKSNGIERQKLDGQIRVNAPYMTGQIIKTVSQTIQLAMQIVYITRFNIHNNWIRGGGNMGLIPQNIVKNGAGSPVGYLH